MGRLVHSGYRRSGAERLVRLEKAVAKLPGVLGLAP